MRIEWPCVSRRRYNALRWQLEQANLRLVVAESEVQHLTDRRLDHVKKMAIAAMKIDGLNKALAVRVRALEIEATPV
jgi:hypothetical protein